MESLEILINQYQTVNECRLAILAGYIDEDLSNQFRNLMNQKTVSKNLHIFLYSYGGDPHAAYRIINLAQDKYENVEIIVPHVAKSSATLLCLGANSIRLAYGAELGPLDIQITVPDNPLKYKSGLIVSNAIDSLRNIGVKFVDDYVVTMLARTNGTIKISDLIDQGIRFAIGAIEPLSKQIDPLIASEHNMGIQIAHEYGNRLLKRYHFKDESRAAILDEKIKQIITKLIYQYPDHGFVIDLKELEEVGLKVFPASTEQETLSLKLGAVDRTVKLCTYADTIFPLAPVETQPNAPTPTTVLDHEALN